MNQNQRQRQQQQQQQNDQHKEQNQLLQELSVAKSELTSGDTTGLVYMRASPGAVFFVTPREEALKEVTKRMDEIGESRKKL